MHNGYYNDFIIPSSPITHKKSKEEIHKKFIANIIVKIDGKWGVIDANGSYLIDAIHEKKPFLAPTSNNIWFVFDHDEIILYDVYFNPITQDRAQFLFQEQLRFDPYILIMTNNNEQYITVIDKLGAFSCNFPYTPEETYTKIDDYLNFFIVENNGLWSAVPTFESEKGVIATASSYDDLFKAMKAFNNEYPNRID